MPDKEEMARKLMEQHRHQAGIPYGECRNSISFDKMPPEVQAKYQAAMEQAKNEAEKKD